jgi:hypothetical protein
MRRSAEYTLLDHNINHGSIATPTNNRIYTTIQKKLEITR